MKSNISTNVHSGLSRKGIAKPLVNRRLWSDDERKILSEMFADNYTETICKILNRSYRSVCSQSFLMGLKKSDAFMKMELEKQAERLKIVGIAGRYAKGRTPENKGKKMPNDVYEKVKHTMFKKGQLPHNSYNDWVEVLRADKTGKQYWMIKLPNDVFINRKKFCGILTENIVKGDEVKSVIGIGIDTNISNYPDDLSQIATSILIEKKLEVNNEEVMKKVVESIKFYFNEITI